MQKLAETQGLPSTAMFVGTVQYTQTAWCLAGLSADSMHPHCSLDIAVTHQRPLHTAAYLMRSLWTEMSIN